MGQTSRESDTDFAKRVGVEYGWLKKWMKRADAPRDRVATDRLVAALGARGWLLDEDGEPPEPDIWAAWRARQHGQHYAVAAEEMGAAVEPAKDARDLLKQSREKKRRAGGRRRR